MIVHVCCGVLANNTYVCLVRLMPDATFSDDSALFFAGSPPKSMASKDALPTVESRIGHNPFISLRQATFLDVFTWVRQFTFHPHVGLLNPPVCVGGLLRGWLSTLPVGVCISTTGTIPRLIPCPQRASESFTPVSICLTRFVEHRSLAIEARWTAGGLRNREAGEESQSEHSERESDYKWRQLCSSAS